MQYESRVDALLLERDGSAESSERSIAWPRVLSPERPAVARMARLGVRSGAVVFARLDRNRANHQFERTGANGREQSLAFAMQKVEGSSPFIRSGKALETGPF
jgi:hypothetical protein